jgi:hypothetical protein
MNRIVPILLTIAIAGVAGFALARATGGFEARLAAAGAAVAQTEQRGCAASAQSIWSTPEGPLTVSATTAGPTCQTAVATLVVRQADEAVLFVHASRVLDPMTLADAVADAQTMQAALEDWIAVPETPQTTATLPEWPEGADGPLGAADGEFPFMVEPYLDREAYLALRARSAPMFCFVQGRESEACLVAENGTIERIGVQLFPG